MTTEDLHSAKRPAEMGLPAQPGGEIAHPARTG